MSPTISIYDEEQRWVGVDSSELKAKTAEGDDGEDWHSGNGVRVFWMLVFASAEFRCLALSGLR